MKNISLNKAKNKYQDELKHLIINQFTYNNIIFDSKITNSFLSLRLENCLHNYNSISQKLNFIVYFSFLDGRFYFSSEDFINKDRFENLIKYNPRMVSIEGPSYSFNGSKRKISLFNPNYSDEFDFNLKRYIDNDYLLEIDEDLDHLTQASFIEVDMALFSNYLESINNKNNPSIHLLKKFLLDSLSIIDIYNNIKKFKSKLRFVDDFWINSGYYSLDVVSKLYLSGVISRRYNIFKRATYLPDSVKKIIKKLEETKLSLKDIKDYLIEDNLGKKNFLHPEYLFSKLSETGEDLVDFFIKISQSLDYKINQKIFYYIVFLLERLEKDSDKKRFIQKSLGIEKESDYNYYFTICSYLTNSKMNYVFSREDIFAYTELAQEFYNLFKAVLKSKKVIMIVDKNNYKESYNQEYYNISFIPRTYFDSNFYKYYNYYDYHKKSINGYKFKPNLNLSQLSFEIDLKKENLVLTEAFFRLLINRNRTFDINKEVYYQCLSLWAILNKSNKGGGIYLSKDSIESLELIEIEINKLLKKELGFYTCKGNDFEEKDLKALSQSINSLLKLYK